MASLFLCQKSASWLSGLRLFACSSDSPGRMVRTTAGSALQLPMEFRQGIVRWQLGFASLEISSSRYRREISLRSASARPVFRCSRAKLGRSRLSSAWLRKRVQRWRLLSSSPPRSPPRSPLGEHHHLSPHQHIRMCR